MDIQYRVYLWHVWGLCVCVYVYTHMHIFSLIPSYLYTHMHIFSLSCNIPQHIYSVYYIQIPCINQFITSLWVYLENKPRIHLLSLIRTYCTLFQALILPQVWILLRTSCSNLHSYSSNRWIYLEDSLPSRLGIRELRECSGKRTEVWAKKLMSSHGSVSNLTQMWDRSLSLSGLRSPLWTE